MKTSSMRILGLLGITASMTSADKLSPISRVVELLNDLAKKVETDGEAEEKLFKKFMCWGKGIVDEKTKSNTAGAARVSELQTYIADIEAGRVEFTTERVDLEKELEQVLSDLEAATAMREKEHSDYLDAKAEMEKGVAALASARTVLEEATSKKGEESALMAIKGKATAGFNARAAEGQKLAYAVELGRKFLTKGDALFLSRVLTGGMDEPPKHDWKKLNRKATFKMDYKARSGKIQDVLARLHDTFSTDLADATEQEEQAQATFDKLKESKEAQKTAAEEALSKLEAEGGAAGMSKADAEAEVELLQTQVADDTKYVSQVRDSMDKKKQEWKTRSELRAGELAAISKAVEILHSDDARDLFKKSLSSQGYSFLQSASSSSSSQRAGKDQLAAFELLNEAAKKTKDARLSSLARLARSGAGGHFDEVLSAIDKMIELLKAEETKELKTKENCEADRLGDTRAAIQASRAMDEMTDSISSLKAKIEELQEEIETAQKQVKADQEELDEASKIRDEQNLAYHVAKQDDEAALDIVKQATSVLQSFYSDNNLMLSQLKGKDHHKAPGDAPLPPPATWEGDYGGATGESTGIIATMTMIQEDIQKDISKATEAEMTAEDEYLEVQTKLEKAIEDGNTLISELEGTKSTKEEEVVTTEGDRTTKNGELASVMDKIKDAEPGCDFFMVNYPVRTQNRQIELDGLDKAKAILSGASFTPPEDTSREMKPGDAFLQPRAGKRASRHVRL
eukprot:TRINITY_DN2773_c0_g1_i1.p1 TRINITY_DN2773_c0_g1~~TRINITY_DN2773_c0_g1_i1.p1  ORF type:complete len:742 (+),score=325.88 TRINITY_DN2773_c0_g1_i1:126-2351(+)